MQTIPVDIKIKEYLEEDGLLNIAVKNASNQDFEPVWTEDGGGLSVMFVFSESPEGHTFWSKKRGEYHDRLMRD